MPVGHRQETCRGALSALLALALLPSAACRSSAPYTVPAAAINAALGLQTAVQQRAAGGCFAACVAGTQCNPRTGFCEKAPCGDCPAGLSCIVARDGFRCGTPGEAGRADVQVRLPPPGTIGAGIGISPRTGAGPPPLHERPAPDAPP